MKYIIALLSLILLSSCSYFIKKTVEPDKSISYKYLLEQHAYWQKSINTLNGNARIMLDSPQYSQNFDAQIALSGKDSLFISVSGPFGMNVGKVFIAKSRFIFYNEMMNQFYSGATADFEGRNFMQFPVEINQLRSVFIAKDQFDVLKKENYEILEDAYFIEVANGQLRYKIWFDPTVLLIKKIEYYETETLLFYKEYSRFKQMDDFWFPTLINYVRPGQKEALTIYFNELEINKPIMPELFTIKISDNAKQIDLSLENQ